MRTVIVISMLAFCLTMPIKIMSAASQGMICTPSAVGSHLNDGTIYISCKEGIPNPAGCTYNSTVRWDASSPGGLRLLNLVTAAYLSGKRMYFSVSGSACSSQNYPTINWGTLQN